VSLILPDKQI